MQNSGACLHGWHVPKSRLPDRGLVLWRGDWLARLFRKSSDLDGIKCRFSSV
ncbi:hypothetical protein sync_2590 [Synechococcus sp. CC9311]|nr:hypothetical protein sync_2590 [Synechococcus sp. CC9311]